MARGRVPTEVFTDNTTLHCRGETGLTALLDSYAAPGSVDERARAAAVCLGLDPSTDGRRQAAWVSLPPHSRECC